MTGRVTKAMLAMATMGLALAGQISSAPHAGAIARTVTTLADGGSGSLRNTIAAATSGDVIVFSVSGTITLTTGQLVIGKDLTIKGPAAGAGGAVSNAGALTVSGSTFNANSGRTGGAIFVFTGKTTITNSTFGGNTASANNPGGGAITTQAAEPVSLTSSTLSGNTAPA